MNIYYTKECNMMVLKTCFTESDNHTAPLVLGCQVSPSASTTDYSFRSRQPDISLQCLTAIPLLRYPTSARMEENSISSKMSQTTSLGFVHKAWQGAPPLPKSCVRPPQP